MKTVSPLFNVRVAITTTCALIFIGIQPLLATTQSLEEIQSQAAAGDVSSQGLLSLLIQLQAVDLADKEAVKLAQDSAQTTIARVDGSSGTAFGSYALGRIYELGFGGVEKDADKAADYYGRALPEIRSKAEAGDPWAAYILHACLAEGRGAEKDEKSAFPWLLKAAEGGNPLAQSALAMKYIYGDGVKKESQAAMKWASRAAEQGSPLGDYALASFYVSENNPEKAITYARKAADKGVVDSQGLLAILYTSAGDQVGVPRDLEEGERWARRAAEQGNLAGQLALLSVCQYRVAGIAKKHDEGDEITPARARAALADMEEMRGILDALRANPQASEEQRKGAETAFEGYGPIIENLRAAIAADEKKTPPRQEPSISDPEPGKFGGPGTETVGPVAETLAVFLQEAVAAGFTKGEPASVVLTIQRGQPLVAAQGNAIPEGTEMFPIRIKSATRYWDYAFYRDPFGEWRWQESSY